MKKRDIEAFVSVEYSLLLPAILLLYCFLICIGVFLHNQCVLQTNMYILSIEGAEVNVEGQAVIDDLRDKEQKLSKSKYILMEGKEINYSIRGNRLVITADAEMDNIFRKFGIGNGNWKFYAESEAWVYSPGVMLRQMKSVCERIDEIMREEAVGDE